MGGSFSAENSEELSKTEIDEASVTLPKNEDEAGGKSQLAGGNQKFALRVFDSPTPRFESDFELGKLVAMTRLKSCSIFLRCLYLLRACK